MAIRRSKNTGVATGGNGSDYGANACGTIAECSTSADETRLLYSPETTSALTATWSKGTAAVPNRYVAISGGGGLADLAKVIDPCESGWVAGGSADVATPTYTTGVIKNGTANKLTLTFDATPKATTLQAYKVVSNLSLSAYRNICTWVTATVGTLPANSLVIKLFTGNDGATGEVASINLSEAQAALSANNPLTLDNGGALPNGVNSIAIYTGAAAPAASSVWKFDTFYATIAGFDLNSVIHKPFRYKGVVWAPNTAIALNEIRVPTFAAACPLVYKCVWAGTSGATEYFTDSDGQSKSMWDKAILTATGDFPAQTLLDGTCVWQLQGDDEAYYMWAIKSLDVAGNRIEIDNQCANTGNAGRGYYGTDEATSLAWLTPYLYPMAAMAGTGMDAPGASGTNAVPQTIRGGYDTNDNIVGVTAISGRNGLGILFFHTTQNSIKITGGIVAVRCYRGINLGNNNSANWMSVREFISCSVTHSGIVGLTSNNIVLMVQHCLVLNSGILNGFQFATNSFRRSFNNKSIGNFGPTATTAAISFGAGTEGMILGCEAINSAGYGFNVPGKVTLINCKTTLNAVAAFASSLGASGRIKNLSCTESTVLQASIGTSGFGGGLLIQNFNGVTGDNRVYYPSMGQATYNSVTHVWTLAVNNVNATAMIPMRHKVGVISCRVANVPYTVSLIVNPTNTNLVAQLKILGNTIAGVNFDTYSQSSGSGAQTLTVTFTPLETGPVEIYLDTYLTNTTLTYTLAYDLDDLSATQSAVAMRIRAIGDELFGDERVMAEQVATFPAVGAVITPAIGGPASWGYPDGAAAGPGTYDKIYSAADEAARNTDPGVANVQTPTAYKIHNVPLVGVLGAVSASSQSSRSDSSYSHSSHSDSSSSYSDSVSVSSGSTSVSSDSSPSSSSLSLEGDCIQAQITAKLKALLETVTLANGYHYDVQAVEQARKVLEINNRWPFILLCENEPETDTDLVIRTIDYIVWFFGVQDDELTADNVKDHDNEIAFHNRNAIADITKAINSNIYLDGFAENVEVEPGTNDLYVDENTTLFGTWCLVRVTTNIDSTDPYKLR